MNAAHPDSPGVQALEMLPFFKAMADATRLKIIGLLAARFTTDCKLDRITGLNWTLWCV